LDVLNSDEILFTLRRNRFLFQSFKKRVQNGFVTQGDVWGSVTQNAFSCL
jgi:hypothetical protein